MSLFFQNISLFYNKSALIVFPSVMYRKRIGFLKQTKKCPLVIREHSWIEVIFVVGFYLVETVGFADELLER
jgi:hypothetical protein